MKLLTVHPGASFSTADVYKGIVPELRALGVEVYDYDLESRLDLAERFLRAEWRRRGKPELKYTKADVVYTASKDVVERALRWDVDGVLIFSGMFLAGDAFVLMKRAGLRTALLLSESPYDSAQEAKVLPWVDVAWTNERSSVRTLRQANPNVNYMPHAYNPDLHYPEARADESEVPAHDVVFVGSMFAERVDLLSQVDWTGIDLGLYGEWSGLPSRHKLRRYVRSSVVNNWYAAALYRKAKIGLNLYRESMGWGKDAPRITHAESMNPRTYELAACGCFQISQARDEIVEVFDTNVATFVTGSQLQHRIRWYLEYGDLRSAHASQTLEDVQPHTFESRAKTILADLGRAGWPVRSAVLELPQPLSIKRRLRVVA